MACAIERQRARIHVKPSPETTPESLGDFGKGTPRAVRGRAPYRGSDAVGEVGVGREYDVALVVDRSAAMPRFVARHRHRSSRVHSRVSGEMSGPRRRAT